MSEVGDCWEFVVGGDEPDAWHFSEADVYGVPVAFLLHSEAAAL